MEKEVMISIKGLQEIDGGEDGTELITQGSYTYGEDGIRLSYMESELTGLGGTKTDFLVRPGEVILSRTGSVTSQMIFQKGRRHDFVYETPHGMLTMGLDTHRIVTELGEHGGDMEIEYDLNFDHAIISRNKFKINVREQGRN